MLTNRLTITIAGRMVTQSYNRSGNESKISKKIEVTKACDNGTPMNITVKESRS